MHARNPFHLVSALALALGVAAGPVRAACDVLPPELSVFDFSPSAVDTTSFPKSVTCTMTVHDDLSGVKRATCMFFSPTFQQSVSCSATVPSPGTPIDGTYSCVVQIPVFAQSGQWIPQVVLEDAVGNSMGEFAGSSSLAVTSTPDSTSPGITSSVFSPTTVDVSTTGQNVTCTMTVTDNLSGVDVAICGFEAPSSSQAVGCTATAPSSGTRLSGVFSCVFAVPHFADAGTWTPNTFVRDRAGNFALASADPLTVTSVPEDVAAPALVDLSFTPSAVSIGDGPSAVACVFDVTDNLSGVATASCTLSYSDPFDPFLAQTHECTAASPVSGTRTSGTFQCSAVIPRYSVGGLWDVDVELVDAVGNILDLTWPDPLDVDCSTGEIETTIRFGSKTSFTWDALADADRYNVYRGLMTDPLPGTGYGSCRNDTDGDLTDTMFVDTETPTTTDRGFRYLVSYTSGGVEMGLGTSSLGVQRTVASPCP